MSETRRDRKKERVERERLRLGPQGGPQEVAGQGWRREKGGGGEDYEGEGEDEGRERMEEEIKGREVGDQTQMLFVITVCNQCVSIILSHDACYPSKIHCHHN